MGIISRLLLFLYVIVVMAVLVCCAAVCLQIFPADFWRGELEKIIVRQETLAVIAVMFLASLCLLSAVFSSNKKSHGEILSGDDVELQSGTQSEVRITVGAIQSVVERAALTVQGVREVTAEVFKSAGEIPVKVSLEIVLGQGYAAPEVSAEINSAVNDALKSALQVSNVPVKTKVTEVTHAIGERERRVV